MISDVFVSSRMYEQLHYLVSVKTHSIMQGCVPFLSEVKKNLYINDDKWSIDNETWNWNTVELLPTLSLQLILAPQDSRYSTIAVWPVLVATCRGVLYN